MINKEIELTSSHDTTCAESKVANNAHHLPCIVGQNLKIKNQLGPQT